MKKSIFGAFLILLTLLMSLPLPLHGTTFVSNIPDIGQEGNWIVSNAEERIMGGMMLQQINSAGIITEDAIVNDYLHGIAKRFQPFIPIQDNKLHFFCVEDPVLNAFAFFGGNIAVHSGLMLTTETESELAAVLAHETAHILQHHLARILTDNKKMMPLTIAQILGGIALGMIGGAPDAGMHIANAAMGTHMQRLINYTRVHEQEADRIGIKIMAQAGFDPKAMSAIFAKMSKKTKYQTKIPEYLLTHPMFEERMADAINRAEKLPNTMVADNLDFHLVRARLSVLDRDNPKRRLNRMKAQYKPELGKDNTAIEYAIALAMLKNRQWDLAEEKILALESRHSKHWLFPYTRAEIARERGQLEQAIEILDRLCQEMPNHYPSHIYHAQILMDANKPAQALTLLEPFEKSYSHDANFIQLLARTHGMLKHRIEVHKFQADWHTLRGEFKEAFQQLDIAQAYAKNAPQKVRTIQAKKIALEDLKKKQEKLK